MADAPLKLEINNRDTNVCKIHANGYFGIDRFSQSLYGTY